MKILETNRLILRHQVLDDLDDLFALYCDPDVRKYIPDAPRNFEETREELEWHMNGHPKYPELGLWATIHKETNMFIGRCGLLPPMIDGQNEVEVAYLISKAFWGQGLGTEAAQAILKYGFEKLNLHRLICLIERENLASINVAKKIGMTFEKEGKDETGPFLLYSINKPPVPMANQREISRP
jgi:ribosomal-protein-alanine N-acetyltransferase